MQEQLLQRLLQPWLYSLQGVCLAHLLGHPSFWCVSKATLGLATKAAAAFAAASADPVQGVRQAHLLGHASIWRFFKATLRLAETAAAAFAAALAVFNARCLPGSLAWSSKYLVSL